MTSRPSAAAPILAAFAVVLPVLLLFGYVAGYLWLGETASGVILPSTDFTDRQYTQPWLVPLFKPAGWLEAKLRQRVVYLDSPSAKQPALEFGP